MGRSNDTFSKREKEKKRAKKKEEKAKKRDEKRNQDSNSMADMIAYVDQYGNIVDTPPDPADREKIKASDIEVSVPKKEKIELDPIRPGKVQFFNHNKGFGFIRDMETGDEYFVHINNCLDPIGEGDNVTFEIGDGPKGPVAIEVKRS